MFFVQPVREVSCALFFRGGSVPAEAKDDIMWVRVLSRVCTPYVVLVWVCLLFACWVCLLFTWRFIRIHLAIHKNRRKGRQKRVGREGGRGSNYFLSITQPFTHTTH